MTWFILILIVFMVASTTISAATDGARWDKRDGQK